MWFNWSVWFAFISLVYVYCMHKLYSYIDNRAKEMLREERRIRSRNMLMHTPQENSHSLRNASLNEWRPRPESLTFEIQNVREEQSRRRFYSIGMKLLNHFSLSMNAMPLFLFYILPVCYPFVKLWTCLTCCKLKK